MDFNKLHETIPWATGGKTHSLTMKPYPGIELRLPGKHAMDTAPVGGDFVVCVTDAGMNWKSHQFTHNDLFFDVEDKGQYDETGTKLLLEGYSLIIEGADPNHLHAPVVDLGIEPDIFYRAVQCLGIAEHRRYHQFEHKFGGRYLPLRYAAGIAEGLWSARDAIAVQRRGRPGCEMLERVHGIPSLTQKLMGI